jgi:NADPH-dependent curcumin reductase CurA
LARLQRDDFQLVCEARADAPEGGMVVRNRFISLDPAQRGWMDDAPSYMPPIALGDPVRATTVGVVESRAIPISRRRLGAGLNGLEDFSVVAPAALPAGSTWGSWTGPRAIFRPWARWG